MARAPASPLNQLNSFIFASGRRIRLLSEPCCSGPAEGSLSRDENENEISWPFGMPPAACVQLHERLVG